MGTSCPIAVRRSIEMASNCGYRRKGMISEKAPFQVDVTKLEAFFRENVAPLTPNVLNPKFMGWTVLSSDGSYRDGCPKVRTPYNPEDFDDLDDVQNFMQKSGVEYCLPTEICTGYVQEIITSWEEIGLVPRRVRFMLLKSGGSCPMHRDAPDWLYSVRLHVPIITNPGAFFEVEGEGSQNLLADGGAYFVKVNRNHRVYNDGPDDRVHLIADVYDTKGISTHHRYTDEDRRRFKERQSPT